MKQRQHLFDLLGRAKVVALIPVALRFAPLITVLNEYNDGYKAYFDRRGPGLNRIRAAGWLDAHRTEKAEIEERQEERRDQF